MGRIREEIGVNRASTSGSQFYLAGPLARSNCHKRNHSNPKIADSHEQFAAHDRAALSPDLRLHGARGKINGWFSLRPRSTLGAMCGRSFERV